MNQTNIQNIDKNFLFFSNVILLGTIKQVFGVDNIDKDITFIKDLFKFQEMEMNKNHSKLKRLYSIINNLHNFVKNVKTIDNKPCDEDILQIDFKVLKNYINDIFLKNNNKFILQPNSSEYNNFENLLIVIRLLKGANKVYYRNFFAHLYKSNNRKKDEIIVNKKEKIELIYLEEFYDDNYKQTNGDIKDMHYFFFLSFFIKKNILNDYLSILRNNNLKIDSPFRQNISNFHFQNRTIWNNQSPICNNFKNNLIKSKNYVIEKNESLTKEEYKKQKNIIEGQIFKILHFHVNQFNLKLEKNKNKIVEKIILKNSSEYDNFKEESINWKEGKRTYNKLQKNIIYFISNEPKTNKRINKKIHPYFIGMKNILKFFGCCQETKKSIFKYEDFEEFMNKTLKEIFNKWTKNNISIEKQQFDFNIYKCDKCKNSVSDENVDNNKRINKSDNIKTISLIKKLEGNRKKINNDFVWFLKISKLNIFIEKQKTQNNYQKINKLKKQLLNNKFDLKNTFEQNEFKELIDNINNQKIKEEFNKKIKNLKNLENPKKFHSLILKLTSMGNRYFNCNNNNNENNKSNPSWVLSLLNKNEYHLLLMKSLKYNNLQKKIKLFLDFKSSNYENKQIKEIIKGNNELYNFLNSYANHHNQEQLSNDEFFYKLYELTYDIKEKDLQQQENNKKDYLELFKKHFKIIKNEEEKSQIDKKSEKYLYLDINLITKIEKISNDLSFKENLECFINLYNNIWYIFLEIEQKTKTKKDQSFNKNINEHFKKFLKKSNIPKNYLNHLEEMKKEIIKIRNFMFHIAEKDEQGYDFILNILNNKSNKNLTLEEMKKFIYSKVVYNETDSCVSYAKELGLKK